MDPPITRVQTVAGASSACTVGKLLYHVQEFFPSRPLGRWICISQPTDLDIITSEREITLVEQLALHTICCTSARFMAVCGPEARSVFSLQAAGLFRSRHLNWISLQRVLMASSRWAVCFRMHRKAKSVEGGN